MISLHNVLCTRYLMILPLLVIIVHHYSCVIADYLILNRRWTLQYKTRTRNCKGFFYIHPCDMYEIKFNYFKQGGKFNLFFPVFSITLLLLMKNVNYSDSNPFRFLILSDVISLKYGNQFEPWNICKSPLSLAEIEPISCHFPLTDKPQSQVNYISL